MRAPGKGNKVQKEGGVMIVGGRVRSDRRTLRISFGLVALLALLLPGGHSQVHAMRVEYVEAKTVRLGGFVDSGEEWYATAYDIANIDEVNDHCSKYPDECKDEKDDLPAMKLCFWHDPENRMELCHRIEDAEPGYTYDRTASLKIKRLCDRHCAHDYGLVLDARNEGFTTGWAGSLSCWVYDRKSRDFVNILPVVGFTEQGEYKILRNLGNGMEAVVVEANHIMDWQKETHYAPHRYVISIYKQNAKGYYEKIGYYKTTARYPSLDDVDSVHVIIPELDKIRRFILSKKKKQSR
jgi:hypothetical protein